VDHVAAARVVYEAIASSLDRSPRTRDPTNALVVWTELGRGLAGLLDRKGADPGLLGRIVDRWCVDRGAETVDLNRWIARSADADRLTVGEIAEALRRIQFRVEQSLVAAGHDGEAPDAIREAFLVTVRGWFPVGLSILRGCPAARQATEAQVMGALRAWCRRYLPEDPSAAKDLGVRIEQAH
jgi:hypothetical protein